MTPFQTLCFAALSAAALAACSNADNTASQDAVATQNAADASPTAGSAAGVQPGPAIGEALPLNIELVDAGGQPRKIGDMLSQNGAVLVFFRSADWCGYCKSQLAQLENIAADVAARGYTLAAISYDDPATLRAFVQKDGLTYAMLSDQGSKMIDTLKIRDPQYTEGKAVGVPYPSIFVVDRDGTVTARSVSLDYKVRPTNDEVMDLLRS